MEREAAEHAVLEMRGFSARNDAGDHADLFWNPTVRTERSFEGDIASGLHACATAKGWGGSVRYLEGSTYSPRRIRINSLRFEGSIDQPITACRAAPDETIELMFGEHLVAEGRVPRPCQ